jgi:hypothetical protein
VRRCARLPRSDPSEDRVPGDGYPAGFQHEETPLVVDVGGRDKQH